MQDVRSPVRSLALYLFDDRWPDYFTSADPKPAGFWSAIKSRLPAPAPSWMVKYAAGSGGLEIYLTDHATMIRPVPPTWHGHEVRIYPVSGDELDRLVADEANLQSQASPERS